MKPIKTKINAYIRGEQGAVAVEFAMIAIAFLTILIMTIESGRLMWTLNGIQYATEQAARFASVQSDETDAETEDVARDALSGMMVDTTPLALQITTESASGIGMVQVQATYPFVFVAAFFLPESLRTITLSAISRRAEVPE